MRPVESGVEITKVVRRLGRTAKSLRRSAGWPDSRPAKRDL